MEPEIRIRLVFSKWRATTGGKVLDGAASRGIQPPGKNILLNFSIPLVGEKLVKPLGKAREFIGGETRNNRP